MKRKANIFIAIMLVFSAFAFSACGKSGDSDSGGTIQTIDRTKEQIYVSVYDGGTGTQWIKEEAEKCSHTRKVQSYQRLWASLSRMGQKRRRLSLYPTELRVHF